MWVCVCPFPHLHVHMNIASSLWSHINKLWQFCVTLWIFDWMRRWGRLILRDYGHLATNLAAKLSLRLCVYVSVCESSVHIPSILSLYLFLSRVNLWGCCELQRSCEEMRKSETSPPLPLMCLCVSWDLFRPCVKIKVCLCWEPLIRQKPWASSPLWGWGVTSKVTACMVMPTWWLENILVPVTAAGALFSEVFAKNESQSDSGDSRTVCALSSMEPNYLVYSWSLLLLICS